MIKNVSRTIALLLAVVLITGGATSCKSKKKLAREKAAVEYTQKVNLAKKDLAAIIDGSTNMSLEEQDSRVNEIISYNIDDPQVAAMITKAEAKISVAKAEAERKIEEERLRNEERERQKAKDIAFKPLNVQLSDIANAPSVNAANVQISKTIQLFETPDVPVLIIISQAGGFNDYDRPTTISKFLNYLKDKQGYNYKVETVKKNSLGKITELELIKK